MPMKKRATSKRKAAPRRRQYTGYRRKARTSAQSQVFSETYKCGVECAGVNAQGEIFIASPAQGTGVKLVTQLSQIIQAGNYRSLWQAYKVLKAKFTIIPKWRGESYNEAAIGTTGGVGITETPRFAYAINDLSADNAAPLTELDVLQDNGCKIRQFVKPVTITVRPRPILEVTSQTVPSLPLVNTFSKANPWIEMDGSGLNVVHGGVDGFFTAYNSLSAGFLALADVYCTVSFVCKDPR